MKKYKKYAKEKTGRKNLSVFSALVLQIIEL